MPNTIVSLSSIPSRFDRLGPVLRALLDQTAEIDRIVLWVPQEYRRGLEVHALPKVPAGVEVLRCDKDYGPATKVIPALGLADDPDTRILYCDDDQIYAPTWAETLTLWRAPRSCG